MWALHYLNQAVELELTTAVINQEVTWFKLLKSRFLFCFRY